MTAVQGASTGPASATARAFTYDAAGNTYTDTQGSVSSVAGYKGGVKS